MASSPNDQPKPAAEASPDVPTPLARYHYWLLVFGQGRPPSWENFQRMAGARARKSRALEAQARVLEAQEKAKKAQRKAEKAKTKADDLQRKAELATQAAANTEALSNLRHTGLTNIVADLVVGQRSPKQLLSKAGKKMMDEGQQSIGGRGDGSDAANLSSGSGSSIRSSISSNNSSKNDGGNGDVEEKGEEGGDRNDTSSHQQTSVGHYRQPTVEDKGSEEGS